MSEQPELSRRNNAVQFWLKFFRLKGHKEYSKTNVEAQLT